MKLTKRAFIKAGATAIATLPLSQTVLAANTASTNPPTNAKTLELTNISSNSTPISKAERVARIQKAQILMAQFNIAAMILEPGAAMDYFTGIQWWRSERLTAVVIPREGEIAVLCPFFEEPSIRESLQVGDDVRVWQEHESPFTLIQQILKDHGIQKGQLAFEQSVRYFVLQGTIALMDNMQHTSADPITQGCRMFKSAHEIALMHKANEITLRAYAHVHANLAIGMNQQDVNRLMSNAQKQLGGSGIWTMALFNEASAYPHGSKQAQTIQAGSTILMDCGCAVHGYQSDISRTFVFGEASKKQQKIWQTVRRGQQIAFEKAQLGTLAGAVDDAVRAYYQTQGLGPNYQLPGLSHRTGHGIGMEGHEPVNFVHHEQTPLQVGMCFSDEPGIYIPNEFGIRLEDCLYMTENGPSWFTTPPDTLESPIGKISPLNATLSALLPLPLSTKEETI
ncbi:Xaa-Pro peptidase family protein [Paraglaciecola sp. 20A4]|uniref:M24 family metallopeptidase n=1 Tax=Paraglaciecola sp. 20A4 TaxID=2687288 RepID=UPI00140ABD15|nr:Xaa-Pro peptidase family protein [Paraglaciecola sp. 20A4]